MKTLIIGDLHLLGSVVLPLIDPVLCAEKVDQIVLLGDYFDQWGQSQNSNLYQQEINFLQHWIEVKRKRNIKIICLLGNHDVPYLTGRLRYYSNKDLFISVAIEKFLFEVRTQLVFKAGDFLISHAGFARNNAPEDWYFEPISAEHLEEMEQLEYTVGSGRGGEGGFGSLLWADFTSELVPFFNPSFPKQIVGHTPVVCPSKSKGDIWDMDTFSLTQDLFPIGNGDLLMLENDHTRIIKTEIADVIQKKSVANTLFTIDV